MVAVEYTNFDKEGYPRETLECVFSPRMLGDFRQGSHLSRADNRRILGWVIKDEKTRTWRFYISDGAFRGDGPDDVGDVMDRVPTYLTKRGAGWTTGEAGSRMGAAQCIVHQLRRDRAPAVGYGRHPDVHRHHGDDEELRGWLRGGMKGPVRTRESATRAVIRNLHRETRMHHEVWESLTLDDVEEFRSQARSWLGDRSELRTITLDTADWVVVHAHFVADKKGF